MNDKDIYVHVDWKERFFLLGVFTLAIKKESLYYPPLTARCVFDCVLWQSQPGADAQKPVEFF